MRLLRNLAVTAPTAALLLFHAAIIVLGIDGTRDTVDMASVFLGLIVALRLMPDAIDRWRRGGAQRGWQLLMGNVLWLLGWVFFCSWTYIVRNTNATEQPVVIPLEVVGYFAALFKLWVLGGIVLSHFATHEPEEYFLAPGRLYWIGIGVAGGLLGGIALAKMFHIG